MTIDGTTTGQHALALFLIVGVPIWDLLETRALKTSRNPRRKILSYRRIVVIEWIAALAACLLLRTELFYTALRFLARLRLQLGGELMLGFADLIQQLVEPFRRHLLARRQWPQHVHQQQAHSDDLGQRGIIAGRPSPQDRLAAPLAERPTARLRRCFEQGVLFLADFESDGFRAQRRLHHVPASSLAITAETSSRA